MHFGYLIKSQDSLHEDGWFLFFFFYFVKMSLCTAQCSIMSVPSVQRFSLVFELHTLPLRTPASTPELST